MGNRYLPPQTKRALETACRKSARKVAKVAPGSGNERALARALSKQACKNIDQKLAALLASQLTGIGWDNNPKKPPGTPPKVKSQSLPDFKLHSKKAKSLKIPLNFVSRELGTNKKVELLLWSGPGKDGTGAVLNLTFRFRGP